MAAVQIPLLWRSDGQVMVPAVVLTAILRQLAGQLDGWPQQGADPTTVQAVQVLLSEVADQIDVDCISITTELDGSA